MSDKLILTNDNIQDQCAKIIGESELLRTRDSTKVFAIPRGGIPAAYALENYAKAEFDYVEDPMDAELFIDDLIDSGKTRDHYQSMNIDAPFITLFNKQDPSCISHGKWVVFPWEETAEKGIEDHITRILQFIGEDPTRGGLLETPKRVAKALLDLNAGYGQKPEDVLKVFTDGAESYDEMVIVKDIPFYSQCEHHMAPFFGTATIGYIPNGKIVGLSKLSRLLDIFARRLQVQERLTNQVCQALVDHLEVQGCGVIIKARHMCMEARGVCKQGHYTITSALRGVMKSQPETRAEFMVLAR